MSTLPSSSAPRVAVIGLGYVGLPLAVEFAHHYDTLGFDISAVRVAQLRAGHDVTREVEAAELASATRLLLSDSPQDLRDREVYVVTVPTPVDSSKRPDLLPLESACRTVGEALSPGNVVVFESTVYPGATEEVCVPLLEAASGLEHNRDFYTGYSPERINPGDRTHRVTSIVKVTSGSTRQVGELVDAIYARVIQAGTHLAPSIRVAEAAKVIENTQRDVNIALINELAILFNRLNVDTHAVLEAAGTKWNFLPFRPGLVGGHCIGVDPYYLAYKAQQVGYHPAMILAGRRTNDQMGLYVASEVVKRMVRAGLRIADARVLVLGFTFKENCPDIRNTRVIDLVRELEDYGARVDVHDPWADAAEVREEYGLELLADPPAAVFDALVLAVAHDEFRARSVAELRAFGRSPHVLYDIKGLLPADDVDGRL